MSLPPVDDTYAKKDSKCYRSQRGFVSNFEWQNLAAFFATPLARTLRMFCEKSEPDSHRQFSHCFGSAFLVFRKMRFRTESAKMNHPKQPPEGTAFLKKKVGQMESTLCARIDFAALICARIEFAAFITHQKSPKSHQKRLCCIFI